MSSPRLLVVINNDVHQEVVLDRQELTIGRAEDNDLVLSDAAVSAHHARIAKVQSAFYLEDLGSTNGTFVNETRIDERALDDLDQIRIGAQLLVFRSKTGAIGLDRETDFEKTLLLRPRNSAVHKPPKTGALLVISGKTDRNRYELSGQTIVIGRDEQAIVRLTGWFAPRVAAIIERIPGGYAIRPGPDAKRLYVDDAPVLDVTPLHDGNVIKVAGVRLSFNEMIPSADR
jgi:pSer/pThr/pTyr-binding forkhead associated (FHA) protein